MKAAFRQAHPVEGFSRGHHDPQRVGIGQPHVLAGEDQHAPEHEARILARVDHLGQPVERRVGVRAAQRLDVGADGVEVVVALFVVQHRALLDAFLGDGEGDADDTVISNR